MKSTTKYYLKTAEIYAKLALSANSGTRKAHFQALAEDCLKLAEASAFDL